MLSGSIIRLVAPWCIGYDCCTISFNKAWTQVLRRFNSNMQHVRESWWWGSLVMVLVGNKAWCLSLVNHTTKTIHHHHSYYGYQKSIWHLRPYFSNSCLEKIQFYSELHYLDWNFIKDQKIKNLVLMEEIQLLISL